MFITIRVFLYNTYIKNIITTNTIESFVPEILRKRKSNKTVHTKQVGEECYKQEVGRTRDVTIRSARGGDWL